MSLIFFFRQNAEKLEKTTIIDNYNYMCFNKL